MWVPGCLIYLAASMVTIAKWYAAPEQDAAAMETGGISMITELKYKEVTEKK